MPCAWRGFGAPWVCKTLSFKQQPSPVCHSCLGFSAAAEAFAFPLEQELCPRRSRGARTGMVNFHSPHDAVSAPGPSAVGWCCSAGPSEQGFGICTRAGHGNGPSLLGCTFGCPKHPLCLGFVPCWGDAGTHHSAQRFLSWFFEPTSPHSPGRDRQGKPLEMSLSPVAAR